MNLEEAKKFLDTCERFELADHAFGDTEVTWYKDGEAVGGGYYGTKYRSIWINGSAGHRTFTGDEALQFRNCGKLGAKASRNDTRDPE